MGVAGFGGGTAQDEVNVIFEQIDGYDTMLLVVGSQRLMVKYQPTHSGVQFTWQNDSGDVIQQTNSQDTDILNNIPPGEYLLTISTDAGCFTKRIFQLKWMG